MKIDAFDFSLPPDLIAQHPVEPRDAARMLHVPQTAPLQDLDVRKLPEFLGEGDVLVVNDTKVIPARLFGKKGEGKIEATLHKQTASNTWIAFCKPAKRFKIGDLIAWDSALSCEVVDKDGGEVTLRFNMTDSDLIKALERVGHLPLPPYIKRDTGSTEADKSSYQTLFANKAGAVAAPTASLHFTPRLMEAIEATGAKLARITLHVGAGTFLPVKVEDTDDHHMHSEWWQISDEAADLINKANRVIAVGTTSLRTLESAALTAPKGQRVQAGSDDTDIFITPGFEFKAVDCLLTNFHLPKSTLFMLVSAFSGLERMQAAYAHAIDQSYRFFSYGDCCFLERS